MIYASNILGKQEVVTNDSYFYILSSLLYIFRTYDLRYKFQFITSMYLTLVRNVHKPIVKYRYGGLVEFIQEFFSLNGLFVTTLFNLDQDIGKHI